jgi:hypothetical protein
MLVAKVKTDHFIHLSDIWGILSPTCYGPVNTLPKFRNRFYDILYKCYILFLCKMMIITSAIPSPSFISSLSLRPLILYLTSPLFPFFPLVTGNVKGKKLSFCATQRRHTRERRYSSNITDLGTRRRWVISFTPRPRYSQGNSPPVPTW